MPNKAILGRHQLQLIQIMGIIALIDAITTQLYFRFPLGGLQISLSVILLPVFLYFNPKINPIIQSFFILTIGLFTRIIFGWADYQNFSHALSAQYFIVFFDLTYGFLYYTLFTRSKEKSLSYWFCVVLTSDFLANAVELYSRVHLLNPDYFKAVPDLFLAACIRSILAIVMVLIYNYYRMMLKRDEHNERYQQLLILVSHLSAETYLMQKNMRQIENVMTEAYALYEGSSDSDQGIGIKALNIAKDVHEIKKSYAQVMQGLSQLTGEKNDFEEMRLKDLFAVLEHSLKTENNSPHVTFKTTVNLKIPQHYYMMSVIRNLVVNAIEAVESQSEPYVHVESFFDQGQFKIQVSDNGHGIKPKDLACIFEPGFSTRFSALTGDMQRGLGLTLVKDIIEEKYHGHIRVDSNEGVGTTFIITLPNFMEDEEQ